MLVKVTTAVTLALVERLFLNNSASNDGDLIRSLLTFEGRTRADTRRAGRKMRNNETGKIGHVNFPIPSFFTVNLRPMIYYQKTPTRMFIY